MPKRLTTEQTLMFKQFMEEFTACWACGWRLELYLSRDWMISRLENAHIIGGSGRKQDRRNIARLCSGCHRLSHGDIIRIAGEPLPKLTLGNILHLKQEFDPEFYSPDYLIDIKIGVFLPEPEKLPYWFCQSRERFRPHWEM